jgi:hypothetical protein
VNGTLTIQPTGPGFGEWSRKYKGRFVEHVHHTLNPWGREIDHPLLRPFSRSIMHPPPSSIETSITFWSEQDITKPEHTASNIGLGETLVLERKGDRLIGSIRGTHNCLYKSRLKIPPDCGVKIEVTNISDVSGCTKLVGKTTVTLHVSESILFEQQDTGLELAKEKGRDLTVEPITVYEGEEGEDEGGGSKHETLITLAEKQPGSQGNDG